MVSIKLLSATVLAGLCTTCFASSVTFTDGNFSTTTWTNSSLVYDDPSVPGPPPLTSTGSINRQPSGGDPGAYDQNVHNITYGDTIYTIAVDSAATYNPSMSGAISNIVFSADLMQSTAGSSAWQLVVVQNGVKYYSVPLGAFSGAAWAAYSLSGLTQSNFDTDPTALFLGEVGTGQEPNFSASGAPLTFGYALGNRLSGPGTITTVLGIDNWSVTINSASSSVPEPNSGVVVSAALALFLFFGVAKRRIV